jgi:ferredoxin-NADP reductase
VRQYSLCGSPAERRCYQVAVLKVPESRGGSQAVHRLAEGDRVRIRGPRNHFTLNSSPRYIFIAGGIGITPLIPMIQEADAAGADWVLHYGGRSERSMAFVEALAAYGDRVRLVPQDTAGMLDLDAILGTRTPDTLVYCCGPEPLLRAAEERCMAWPPNSFHLERFTAKERSDEEEDTAFEVVLQRSGKTITVEPGVTVFDAMRAAGVSVLGSCLEGICGTCEQGVLEGEVDHRDSVLDDDEREAMNCMMVCVSRARSPRLVLDA